MTTAQEEIELQKQKRKRKQTGNSSLDLESEEQLKDNYKEIKKLDNTERASSYKKKQLVEQTADILGDRIKRKYEKYPNPLLVKDQLDEELKGVSTEIRHQYPKLNEHVGEDGKRTDDNENLRDYITKILSKYRGGIYVDKQHKEIYEDYNKLKEPSDDVNTNTKRYYECFDELHCTDKSLLDGRAIADLAYKHDLASKELEQYAKRNKLPLNDEGDWTGTHRKSADKNSLQSAPPPEDGSSKLDTIAVVDELTGVQNDIEKMKQDITNGHYLADDPEIRKNYKAGIQSLRLLIKPYRNKTWQVDMLQWVEILRDHFEGDYIFKLMNGHTLGYVTTGIGGVIALLKKKGVKIDNDIIEELSKSVHKQLQQRGEPYKFDEIYKTLNTEVKTADELISLFTDVMDFIDPKTGKRRRIKLTPKQIKMMGPKILNDMHFICTHFPFFITMCQNYGKQQGYRQKRKKDTSPKQSDA